jgi:hypothetical protein
MIDMELDMVDTNSSRHNVPVTHLEEEEEEEEEEERYMGSIKGYFPFPPTCYTARSQTNTQNDQELNASVLVYLQ